MDALEEPNSNEWEEVFAVQWLHTIHTPLGNISIDLPAFDTNLDILMDDMRYFVNTLTDLEQSITNEMARVYLHTSKDPILATIGKVLKKIGFIAYSVKLPNARLPEEISFGFGPSPVESFTTNAFAIDTFDNVRESLAELNQKVIDQEWKGLKVPLKRLIDEAWRIVGDIERLVTTD